MVYLLISFLNVLFLNKKGQLRWAVIFLKLSRLTKKKHIKTNWQKKNRHVFKKEIEVFIDKIEKIFQNVILKNPEDMRGEKRKKDRGVQYERFSQ